MNEPIRNPVTLWFGKKFTELHPLLQQLHRFGGTLSGKVCIDYGKGLAGCLGRRLAKKLGLPSGLSSSSFEVNISHQDGKLYWSRQFSNKHKMLSIFEPVGYYPDGYWIETTGKLKLHLTVDVINGGWHWRVLRTKLGFLPLPRFFLPATEAWKNIVDDSYQFQVSMRMPLLGKLLSYHGLLNIENHNR